jgi:hypothetical protein
VSSSEADAEYVARWTKAGEKYDAYWANWGRHLLRENPNGLGREPDFSNDGNARIVWSAEGFRRHQEAMWILGECKTYQIGGKDYTQYPTDSVEDQISIAKKAFKEADAYWHIAKEEADQRAAEEHRIAAAAAAQEAELNALSLEAAAVDTIHELEIKATKIRDRLHEKPDDEAVFLHRQLSIIHARLIELERENARSNWRWAVAGFVVGAIGLIVGIGFPVWDLTHRPAERVHQTDQRAITNESIE